MVELQKTTFSSAAQSITQNDKLRYDRAVQLYENLRQSDRRPADCENMATVILQILAQREKLHREILSNLSEVMVCRRDMRRLMQRLLSVKSKLATRAEDLKEMQKQRQVDLWKLLQSKRRREDERRRSMSSSYSSFSSITASSCSTQSTVLIEESSKSFEKLAGLLNMLKRDQINDTEIFDWEFLEEESESTEKGSV